MANSASFSKPHSLDPDLTSSIQQNASKSYTHFFSKSLIIIFILIVLPLLPSKAPEFINKSVFIKLWEPLHLSVIGIILCYCLFSRRNVRMNIETNVNSTRLGTHFSGIFHVTSFFEDGFENLCGLDEKRTIQPWNSRSSIFENGFENPHGFDEKKVTQMRRSQDFQGESLVLDGSKDSRPSIYENGFENPHGFDEKKVTQVWNSRYFQGESMVLDGSKDSRSSIYGNVFENPNGFDEKKVTQTWNSQHFRGESMVVFANGNYGLDQWSKLKSNIEHKPLGLPIRSVRSRIVDTSTPESINASGSSSSSKGFSDGDDKFKKGRIRGLVPINLEKKFKETIVPSPIPWGSRSGRMEMREEMGTLKPPLHSRPLSVGQFDFECLKSQSFRSPKSSRTSSTYSSSRFSSSSSVSSEFPDSKIEDLKREKTFNGETSFVNSNTRRFSIGSSSEMNVRRSFEGNMKDFGKSKIENSLGRGKQSMNSLNSDEKPVPLVKRGKSVRTIRSSEQFVQARKPGEVCPNHIDDKVGMKCDNAEAVSMENTGGKYSTFLNQNGEKQDFVGSNVVESEKDSDSEFDSFQVSSDEEEAGSDIVSDAEPDSDEVDKKAGEFIAKFREQIRLQKLASIKGFHCL